MTRDLKKTGDESWCFMYDPETKRQRATWFSPKKPKAQKLKIQKLRVKTMLTAFFYAEGIIHHEFVPEKQIVNGKLYKEVIKKLITRVYCVRPEFQESGSWYLLHDNAPAHSSGIVSECLAERGIPVLSRPPYSADLAAAHFSYFLN
jgi:hypothetical protein